MTEFSRSDESPIPLELRNSVNPMQNKSKKQRHSENAENKRQKTKNRFILKTVLMLNGSKLNLESNNKCARVIE